MRLLLDTHVLLWWLDDDPRLRASVRGVIADGQHEAFVSVVSFWELSIKQRKGKLRSGGIEAWKRSLGQGFRFLDIERPHLESLALLPQVQDHKDPFDQLLLAQAETENAALITADRALTQYGVRCIGVR